ncbi:MAG: antiterminator LoaP [Lachnospiraceae bacterium]|nr:antiterminator LoaP [Lachnospiraceae bacterium]
MSIWYAVYCPIQQEQKVLQICKEHLSQDALQDAFVFTYDRMRRYEGDWHLERQRMFPGYVFLESTNLEQLNKEIEKVSYLKKILLGDGTLTSLQEREEMFLRRFCGEVHHFGMSRGYIRDGRTFVTEGPLRGQEQLIRKIDRHKRIARVSIPTVGCCREIQVGLEIMSKS